MGEPFRQFSSRVVPLGAENVDTDQVVPARYLKVTDKAGLADALFRDWRFNEDGTLREPRFVLDQPGMAGRAILLVGDNFGAGSSREHAPWALAAWGIRTIISTSFADIFRNNALKNGVLPVAVDTATHTRLFELVATDPDAQLTVDLSEEGILLPDGTTIDFTIDPFAKRMLLAGTDEIGYVVAKLPEIRAWEATHPGRVDTRLETPLDGSSVEHDVSITGAAAQTNVCSKAVDLPLLSPAGMGFPKSDDVAEQELDNGRLSGGHYRSPNDRGERAFSITAADSIRAALRRPAREDSR